MIHRHRHPSGLSHRHLDVLHALRAEGRERVPFRRVWRASSLGYGRLWGSVLELYARGLVELEPTGKRLSLTARGAQLAATTAPDTLH